MIYTSESDMARLPNAWSVDVTLYTKQYFPKKTNKKKLVLKVSKEL